MLIFIERAPLLEMVSHTGVLPLLVTKLQLRGVAAPDSKPLLAMRFGGLVRTSLKEKPPWEVSMGSMVSFIEIPSIVPFSPRLSLRPSPLEITGGDGVGEGVGAGVGSGSD